MKVIGWCVKVKGCRVKVIERCVKVMMGWFVKVEGCCEGDGGMFEGDGMVCEYEGMVCKGDVMVCKGHVMGVMVMGRCGSDFV